MMKIDFPTSVHGLAVCCRYAYPPNSLSLCGPDKKEDLRFYAATKKTDKGTIEILSLFSTLYPYLMLIASENKIKNPFDLKVVEAYWLGNSLLYKTKFSSFSSHLTDNLLLKKKIKKKEMENLLYKLYQKALPCHSFHVLNIYLRTGHLNIPHTVETTDACIINWGKIIKILPDSAIIETKPLTLSNDKLVFGRLTERKVLSQGKNDILFPKLKTGDFISYHWGYFCEKLSRNQLRNLCFYNRLSLNLLSI